jgi:hypothetical protein
LPLLLEHVHNADLCSDLTDFLGDCIGGDVHGSSCESVGIASMMLASSRTHRT